MHAALQLIRQTTFSFLLLLGCSQIGLVRTDIWPAIPLAVKSPYLSTWTRGPYLGNSKTQFWTGYDSSLTLLVRVNNTTYTIAPNGSTSLQTGLNVTPTQSIFSFTIGPVIITYKFFTPIDTDDLKRLSLPVSYLAVSAHSTDNQNHPMQVFVGWGREWSAILSNRTVQWNSQQVGPLFDMHMEQVNQSQLNDYYNGASWGTFHVFTNTVGTTFGIDNVNYLVSNFTNKGQLNNNIEQGVPPAPLELPTMGFAKDISVGSLPSANVYFGMSWVARPAINTTQGPMNHLWEDFFEGDEKQMMQFAFDDAEAALDRCEALDDKILADAAQEGGQSYSTLVSAALRQAFGGIELVGTQNRTWGFMKVMSAQDNVTEGCNAVDLIYANMPVHMYLNPKMLKYLLEPLLIYQELGNFPEPWAVSNLGFVYPQCTGGSHESAMGVKQSANMIIMIDAYVRTLNDTDFLREHYVICKKWADYLVTNGLYPESTLISDGGVANSTNLSFKAIVGIAAMADIALRIDSTADYSYYRSVAEMYTDQWINLAQEPSLTHIKLSYNDKTGDSWVLFYDLYANSLLGTNLICDDIIRRQEIWYLNHNEKYGIPVSNGTKVTQVDWLMFTAAVLQSKIVRHDIYDRLALHLNDDLSFHPFDVGFNTTGPPTYSNYFAPNQPSVGAVFAPLTITDYSRLIC